MPTTPNRERKKKSLAYIFIDDRNSYVYTSASDQTDNNHRYCVSKKKKILHTQIIRNKIKLTFNNLLIAASEENSVIDTFYIVHSILAECSHSPKPTWNRCAHSTVHTLQSVHITFCSRFSFVRYTLKNKKYVLCSNEHLTIGFIFYRSTV